MALHTVIPKANVDFGGSGLFRNFESHKTKDLFFKIDKPGKSVCQPLNLRKNPNSPDYADKESLTP